MKYMEDHAYTDVTRTHTHSLRHHWHRTSWHGAERNRALSWGREGGMASLRNQRCHETKERQKGKRVIRIIHTRTYLHVLAHSHTIHTRSREGQILIAKRGRRRERACARIRKEESMERVDGARTSARRRRQIYICILYYACRYTVAYIDGKRK